MTPEQKDKIRVLYQTQDELRRLKKLESELRDEVVNMLSAEDEFGTKKQNLSDRMEVVVTRGRRLTVNAAAFADKEAQLRQKGLIGDNAVVVMKPAVSAAAYKYLSDQDKVAFADVFEYKPTKPTIEFKTIKD